MPMVLSNQTCILSLKFRQIWSMEVPPFWIVTKQTLGNVPLLQGLVPTVVGCWFSAGEVFGEIKP